MNTSYEGMTAEEWIALLQSNYLNERCAAALALAEMDPHAPLIRAALVAALNDPDAPVQGAAQAALGLVAQIQPDHRRKMFHALTCANEDLVRTVLYSLEELVGPDAMKTVPIFGDTANTPQLGAAAPTSDFPTATPGPKDERITTLSSATEITSEAPVAATPARLPMAANEDVPDIVLVHFFPWWFLLGGIALCLGLCWLLRGVWWSRWGMVALAATAGILLYYAWIRRKNDSPSLRRFRAKVQLASSVIFASTFGFAILVIFPEGSIYIDNASGHNVRLLLNDQEWLTIKSGESKKRSLTEGTYRVTVQSAEGNLVLDAHDIEVSACNRHVLNVLGAQIYFDGIVQYGNDGGSMKLVTAKWIRVPDVDYLFRDPPKTIVTARPVNKSYFTKGAPPMFNNEDRH